MHSGSTAGPLWSGIRRFDKGRTGVAGGGANARRILERFGYCALEARGKIFRRVTVPSRRVTAVFSGGNDPKYWTGSRGRYVRI
jgi:hypothetical protein